MGDKVTIGRVLRLLAISAKMDLLWLLRDAKFAVLVSVCDMVNNLAIVSVVFLIAARFGGVGGMGTDEVLFMMAYSTLVTGLFAMFGAGNNIHISRVIGRGQLEHLFIQPLPLAVQLSTSGFMPFTGGGNFIVGAVLMAVAVGRLGLAVTFGWLASLAGYLLTTLITLVARAYLVSSLAFYAPVAAEEIASVSLDDTWFLSTFPLSGMPAFVQVPLLTVMPEGLMAWFPALCLLGRPPLQLGAYYPMLFALLISLLAGCVFRKGLRYYVQKGSNRYVPHGFRR